MSCRLCLELTCVLLCLIFTSTSSLPLSASPFIDEFAPKQVFPSVELKSRESCSSCIFRYSSINYPNSTFFHLHIPKTGGTTFALCLNCLDKSSLISASRFHCNTMNISEVRRNVKVKNMISCEIPDNSLHRFLQTLAIPHLKIITFLRRPIYHVMSAFLHRKYHDPRHAACSSFDAIFRSIAAKRSGDPAILKSQTCEHYDINNMQTTALTLSSLSSHRGANLTAAVAFISKSVFFFGITEYYRASLCLFAYQLGQLEMHRGVCDCSVMQNVNVRHSNKAHNMSASVKLDELSIDMMKALQSEYINLDNMLYSIALQVFLQRVIIAERESGMQLVCEAADGVELSNLKASLSNPDWYNHA